MRLRSLLSVEAEIVERAQAAGRAMAAFRDRGAKDPEQAVKTLAEFGSAITDAFHARLSGIYGSGALRPLGTMIFVEAAAAFLPDPQTATKPSALFELTVVKQQSPYALPSFLDAADPKRPETADIVVQERLFV
jgi:hypothetical protein